MYSHCGNTVCPTTVPVIQAAVAVPIRIELIKNDDDTKNKSNNLDNSSIHYVQQAQALVGVGVLVSGCCICGRCGSSIEAASVGTLSGCWFCCFGGLGGFSCVRTVMRLLVSCAHQQP